MHTQPYIPTYSKTTAMILCCLITATSINSAHASQKNSPALKGFLGLNHVPNARMDETGTIRIGSSTLDPYLHGYIGIQIAVPLHINISQTAETSSLTGKAKRLYPGIDLKLRLLKESTYRPEISLGLQSAIGHKRMASEYIALSKAYKNVDFTAGLGWGRFGSGGHLNNPLKSISSHFGKNRNQNSETPNTPNDWFSGDSIGIFGGIEYFTPIKGLSLKLDYNSDKYEVEKATSDYNPASPLGLGISYNYGSWANASIGVQGTDKIFAKISLQSTPSKWHLKHKKYSAPKPFYEERSMNLNKTKMMQDAQNDGINISNITTNGQTLYADLELSPKAPSPQQIGRAVRHISMHAGENIEKISITPTYSSLRTNSINIMRKDVENSVNNNNSSPQEIWKNTDFIVSDESNWRNNNNLSTKGVSYGNPLTLSLENQISLSEEDSGILYRSSALIQAKSSPFLGILTGAALRINLKDNLDKIENLRPKSQNPVRSDIYDFTRKRFSLENAYIAYPHSFTPELHTAVSIGYLEENYAGYGGGILYRPFKSRFAIGAELWRVARRNPYSMLNAGLNLGSATTGHINAWYDLPHHEITLNIRAGKFLAGDTGGSLGLEKTFKNGTRLSAVAILSNYSELDLFGGNTSAYHAINLTLPLGSAPFIPEGSELRTKIAPFGRDIGQSLNKPIDLFSLTENFTLDHMANHWVEIMD